MKSQVPQRPEALQDGRTRLPRFVPSPANALSGAVFVLSQHPLGSCLSWALLVCPVCLPTFAAGALDMPRMEVLECRGRPVGPGTGVHLDRYRNKRAVSTSASIVMCCGGMVWWHGCGVKQEGGGGLEVGGGVLGGEGLDEYGGAVQGRALPRPWEQAQGRGYRLVSCLRLVLDLI